MRILLPLLLLAAPVGAQNAPAPAPAPAAATPPAAATTPADDAAGTPELPAALKSRAAVLEAQARLDRLNFGPGAIDGRMGGNLRGAIIAFQKANAMRADGQVSARLLAALRAKDDRPVLAYRTIDPADVAGPFMPRLKPDDYAAMSKLPKLGYHSPREAIAERFHMDEGFLAALNPNATFEKAGERIVVVVPARDRLAEVARITVNKREGRVRAYGADGKLVATYPATVGSGDLPSPSGTWAVKTVADAPTYTYDPSRLSFGDKSLGKVELPAGPNNPVGAVWIDLTKDTYGIHGTPEPSLIGKRESHGCVRLTNWDARQLANAVKAGTKVVFG